MFLASCSSAETQPRRPTTSRPATRQLASQSRANRSRFLPPFLGIWLALAGIAWVILSLTGILLPQYHDKVDSYSQPAFFGEIAFMLWLLIKGAKPQVAASSSAVA